MIFDFFLKRDKKITFLYNNEIFLSESSFVRTKTVNSYLYKILEIICNENLKLFHLINIIGWLVNDCVEKKVYQKE